MLPSWLFIDKRAASYIICYCCLYTVIFDIGLRRINLSSYISPKLEASLAFSVPEELHPLACLPYATLDRKYRTEWRPVGIF